MTDYKKDFPLLAESDIAYLDNAATEQRPACVLDAEREFYERWNANPLRGLYELGVEATEQYEHARERFRGRWRPDEPEPRLNIWSVNRTAVLRRRKSVMPSHRTQSLPR